MPRAPSVVEVNSSRNLPVVDCDREITLAIYSKMACKQKEVTGENDI